MSTTVISVEGLQKTFFQGLFRKRVDAVRSVTFDVTGGEIFGFVGPNGSGKTTTIKMLTGLIAPSGGKATLFGEPIGTPRARARIGFLPENPYIHPYVTPREFVEMCGSLSGLRSADLRARSIASLERTGVAYAADRQSRRLSKGMLQRTGLAAALVADPELLILDEPMSGLDPVGRKEVRDLILDDRRKGRTIFFSTHILADVETICDRVTVLRAGEAVVSGKLSELLRGDVLRTDVVVGGDFAAFEAKMKVAHVTTQRVDHLVVEISGAEKVADVLRAALDHGLAIVEVTPRRETLEDLFLRRAIAKGSEGGLPARSRSPRPSARVLPAWAMARAVDPSSEPAEHGILAIQHLRFLTESGAIAATTPLAEGQLQPNSLDLRLGARAHRVRCSFLPGSLGVDACLGELGNDVHELSLDGEGAVIEPNVPYLVELTETLALPRGLSARANPKSSTGRLDVFARVIADTGEAFDEIPSGYRGRLFVHLISRSFPIRLRKGDRLVQLRVQKGDARIGDAETHALHAKEPLVASGGAPVIEDGLLFSAALSGDDVVGFRARAHTPLLDLAKVGGHDVAPFWEPIASPRGALVLEPDAFYVLASHERVTVPPSVCAEMVPFDAKSGELRTHYAGFFDSGFGAAGGARVVLEIRNRDTPFLLRDRQRIFRFQLHRNLAIPDVLYGDAGSHYQGQGLRLAKQFRSS